MKKNEPHLQAKYLAIFQRRKKDTTQPIAAFCKKQGISPAAYYRWKNILRLPSRRDVVQERFLPVTMSSINVPSNYAAPSYNFRFPNGATLQITGGLNSADLSALVGSIGKLAP
jgi:hypothetical protein